MSDRLLENILGDIRHNEKTLATDLSIIKANVRPSYEMAAREAKEALVKLKADYQQKLLQNSYAFFLEGPKEKVAQFVDRTRKTVANAFVVSADAYYQYLGQRVDEVVGPSREFSTQQVTALMLAIRYLAREIGVDEPAPPKLDEIRICESRDDLLAYIRDLAMTQDHTVASAYLARQVSDAALAIDCGANNVAIVVTDCDDRDFHAIANLFGHHSVILIGKDQEVDETFVMNTYGQRSSGTKKPGRPKSTMETK